MRAVVLLFLILPLSAFCQTGRYVINGESTVAKNGKVYLIYNNGAVTTIDSAEIKNGLFSLKGSIEDPRHGALVLDHAGRGLMALQVETADKLNIYLERGQVNINFPDSISKAEIKGSQLNADFKDLQEQLKPITTGYSLLMASFQTLPPEQRASPQVQETMFKKYQDIMAAQKKILAAYVRNNPDKYTSFDALRDYGGEEADAPQLEELFNSLSPAIKTTKSAKAYYSLIQQSKRTAIGSIAPDFSQNDADGHSVTLSSFRGKYVLIDFWASWCGPCRQENPNLVSMYHRYKDKNFTVLGVSLDRPDGKRAWLNAIKDDGLVWTQVSDLQFWKNEVAVKYGITAIPKNFLLDPEGKIIAKNIRGEELRLSLARLIK